MIVALWVVGDGDDCDRHRTYAASAEDGLGSLVDVGMSDACLEADTHSSWAGSPEPNEPLQYRGGLELALSPMLGAPL